MLGKLKPCKFCGSYLHQSFQCQRRPNIKPLARSTTPIARKTSLRRDGKIAKAWIKVKKEWFHNNPPDEHGYYYCYIKNCGKPLVYRPIEPPPAGVEIVTLDHIDARSRRPDKFDDPDNLAPCCMYHNRDKGSLSLDEYYAKLGI